MRRRPWWSRSQGKSLLAKRIKKEGERVGEGQYKVGNLIVWIPSVGQVQRHRESAIKEEADLYLNIPPME